LILCFLGVDEIWRWRLDARDADGSVTEGEYVAGEMRGQWILREPDGTEEKVDWRNGEIVE